jgi:hypothetical protein
MTYPAFDISGIADVEAHDGPVTCAACGCRLQPAAGHQGWIHFLPMAGSDARGCRVECADAVHDRLGRTAGA